MEQEEEMHLNEQADKELTKFVNLHKGLTAAQFKNRSMKHSKQYLLLNFGRALAVMEELEKNLKNAHNEIDHYKDKHRSLVHLHEVEEKRREEKLIASNSEVGKWHTLAVAACGVISSDHLIRTTSKGIGSEVRGSSFAITEKRTMDKD
jgi:hypothetical protein